MIIKKLNENRKELHLIIALCTYIIVFWCLFPAFTIAKDAVGILIGGGAIAYYMIKNKVRLFGIRELLLLFTIVAYGLNRGMYAYIAYASVNWLIFVLLGQVVAHKKYVSASDDKISKKYDVLTILVNAVIWGYFIHAMANFVMWMRRKILFDWDLRVWEDLFVGVMLPATQHELFAFPILATPFIALLVFKNNKRLSIAYLAASVLGLGFILAGECRSGVMVAAAVFMWELVLFYILNRKDSEKRRFVGRIVLILAAAVIAGVIFLAVAIQLGLFGLSTEMVDKLVAIIARDGGILNNVRFRAQRRALSQLFTHPRGGFDLSGLGVSYIHNVWLDMAHFGGIAPFITFLMYTLLSLADMFRILRDKSVSQEFKCLITGVYWAFMLYYFVEPAFNSSFYFFAPWLFINGIMYRMVKKG